MYLNVAFTLVTSTYAGLSIVAMNVAVMKRDDVEKRVSVSRVVRPVPES